MTDVIPVGESPYAFFTSKERDPESGLDYFGARYYSGAQGRFTSVDPAFLFKADKHIPQRWNRYTYALNNPFLYIDPDGRLTIIVHGTGARNNDWAGPGTSFNKAVSKTFGEQAIEGKWTGGNSVYARREGARELAALIKSKLRPGESLNIVAHSHGGNVVKDYTQLPGVPKIDTLVNLGTPQRNEHIIDLEQVGNYFNVYSIYDGVQDNFAGYDWESVIFMSAGPVPQRSAWANNIRLDHMVVEGHTRRVGHPDYHTINAWRWIEFYINQVRTLKENVTVQLKY